MARIQTTHVGSLVRPDELIAFLRQIDRKDPAYDEAAHTECLTRSVQGVVAKQKEIGVDIVSDGEYGKTAWNYYVYERLGGIELRLHPPGEANFASVNENPTDWARSTSSTPSTSPRSRTTSRPAATGPASAR
jgi:methionine synthase II (cobalamin-independent)